MNNSIIPMNQNPIYPLQKVVLNFGIGNDDEKRQYVLKLLKHLLPGRKEELHISKHTNKEFGLKKGSVVGISITIRKQLAFDILKKLIKTRKYINKYSITPQGALNFGITDINHIEGVNFYNNSLIGLDVCVVFKKMGAGINTRTIMKKHLNNCLYPSQDEIIDYIQNKLEVQCK